MSLMERDTDEDWRRIGRSQPYWGVLTQPRFKMENLSQPALDEFYGLGRNQVQAMVLELHRLTERHIHVKSVLEFGCGAGRLAEAFTEYADEVVGYDISPGMLEVARARGGRVQYTDVLPERSFDWINAFTVFQHIPPARGLAQLRDLLGRLAPEGLVSLQVTLRREASLQPPRPPWWRRLQPQPVGEMRMYDYDLGAVMEILDGLGIRRTCMVSTNHGGHHGVIIFGQRGAPVYSY